MKRYSFAPIQARPFPTLHELDNPWIFGNVRSIINVCEHTSEIGCASGEKEKQVFLCSPLALHTLA